MFKEETTELAEKISRGIALANRRLIEQKKREDGELVIYQDGKITRIKARDIQEENCICCNQ